MAHSGGERPAAGDRRNNVELRELLDELLAVVRQLVRRGRDMKPEELGYAQQRLEWLSDEIWAAATRGEDRAADPRHDAR